MKLDKSEWLEDINKGESSLKAFLACVDESVCERENRKFEEGLNSKVKLSLYKTFGKEVEFKKYLHGLSDAGSRLLFKFRSGTNGLNEELGRHRGREGKKECMLCGAECESVSHVLWDCPAYSRSRTAFLQKLQMEMGDSYESFDVLDSLGKASFILGNELWEENFASRLSLVKEFIVDIWEERKSKLYGDSQCTQQPSPHSPAGDLGDVARVQGRTGKPGTGKLNDCVCLCGSALNNGCVVNGMNAMAAC